MSGRAGRPAVFVDRDGTLIREAGYLSEPEQVALLDGAVEALLRFQAAGYAIIIVTNQSGIARGYYDQEAYRRVERAVTARLEAEGVHVEGTYHCPHHPDFTGPCDCRKPATGLFERAAADLHLDLAASVYIGDRMRDVEPARQLGGRGILVRTGYGAEEALHVPPDVLVTGDLRAAAAAVLDTA